MESTGLQIPEDLLFALRVAGAPCAVVRVGMQCAMVAPDVNPKPLAQLAPKPGASAHVRKKVAGDVMLFPNGFVGRGERRGDSQIVG